MKNIIGIYFLKLNREIIYIGQSTNIYHRLSQHKSDKIIPFNNSDILEYPKELLFETEKKLIIQHKPKYNKYIPKVGLSKIVSVSEEVWKLLMKIKLEEEHPTMDKVIAELIAYKGY